MKLQGKIAVVTGAGSGNGRAIALEYSKEGATVVVLNRTKEKGEETLDLIMKQGGEGIALQCDVGNIEKLKETMDSVIEKYGRIDILVNNAGVFDGQNNYETTSEEDFDRVININLKSVFMASKFVIPKMVENKAGVIINISSVAGTRGGLASPAYTASKYGVIGLTGDLAKKYAKDGIRAIAICPGMIKTNMTKDLLENPSEQTQAIIGGIPIGRAGEAHEIGKLALFLASDDSSYITGTHIVIDGAIYT